MSPGVDGASLRSIVEDVVYVPIVVTWTAIGSVGFSCSSLRPGASMPLSGAGGLQSRRSRCAATCRFAPSRGHRKPVGHRGWVPGPQLTRRQRTEGRRDQVLPAGRVFGNVTRASGLTPDPRMLPSRAAAFAPRTRRRYHSSRPRITQRLNRVPADLGRHAHPWGRPPRSPGHPASVPRLSRGCPAKDRETTHNDGSSRDANAQVREVIRPFHAGRRFEPHQFPKPRVAGSIPAGRTNPYGGPKIGTRKTGSMWPRSRTLIWAITTCITALRSCSAPPCRARSISPTSPASSGGVRDARLTLRYLLGQFRASGLERCELRRELLDAVAYRPPSEQ
jgi:hypothetical protein